MTEKKKPGREETGLEKPTEQKDSFFALPDAVPPPVWARPIKSVSSYLTSPMLGSAYQTTAVGTITNPFGIVPERFEEERRLSAEIVKLESEVLKRSSELQKEKEQSEAWKKLVVMLGDAITNLKTKEQLRSILDRIGEEPRQLLLQSKTFQDKFLKESACYAYVMSVDIRRSTELMLKARTPTLYAEFISQLCGMLRETILEHHGVYDKFTGDGILAFFPDFYTGPDAGYYTLACADEMHRIFGKFYNASRKCFTAVLKDVGLGIGIDAGAIRLVQLGEGLIIVGTPVVYACRMSGAPAGKTLLNQPAYEPIIEKYKDCCAMEETEIEVKHEGRHVAYCVRMTKHEYGPEPPAWHAFRAAESAADAPGDNSAENLK